MNKELRVLVNFNNKENIGTFISKLEAPSFLLRFGCNYNIKSKTHHILYFQDDYIFYEIPTFNEMEEWRNSLKNNTHIKFKQIINALKNNNKLKLFYP